MTFLLVLIVFAGIAYRAMNADERARLARNVLATIRHAKDLADQRRRMPEPFRDALRARTRWAIMTPAIVAVNVAVFVGMLFGSGALSDPGVLIAWGANFGPQTTSGEWWRLATSMFVHTGFVHLLVDTFALLQLGLLLERLLGRVAFAAVYVSAGVFANLVRLSASPVDVSVGASGAIFGIYGLLLASAMWSLVRRSAVTIPLRNLRRLVPAAAVFVLYNGLQGDPDQAGFAVGVACGLVLARGVGVRKPAAVRVALTLGVTAAIAVAAAVPFRGIVDVRPEIARVVAAEDRTASAYETARKRFTEGRMTTEKLIELIDRTIVPELGQARARLKTLEGVPELHQPLVAHADEYLQLRDESWHLRADGLRKTNMLTLRKADAKERASLDILHKIRPADPK